MYIARCRTERRQLEVDANGVCDLLLDRTIWTLEPDTNRLLVLCSTRHKGAHLAGTSANESALVA